MQHATRVIYYDALPVKKENQSEDEFEKKLEEKLNFLNRIRGYPNFSVKDGITKLRTDRRAKSASQLLEQKGVDTWIAVDAMKLSPRDLVDFIEIWTSDSDIYPVFEAIQDTKSKGILKYQRGKANEELIFSADIAEPIFFSHIVSITRGRFFADLTCSISHPDQVEQVFDQRTCLLIATGPFEGRFFHNEEIKRYGYIYDLYGRLKHISSKSAWVVLDYLHAHDITLQNVDTEIYRTEARALIRT